eukprot:317104_1
MDANLERLKLLISGYMHQQELTFKILVIPNVMIQLVFDFYDKLIKFGKYNTKQFILSDNNTVLTGKGSCGGFMIYADISMCNKGYNKGIHAWSVVALSTDYTTTKSLDANYATTNAFSECFQSIGITSTYDDKCNYNSGHWRCLNSSASDSFFQGHRGNWKHNEIITVVLNCNNWSVTYYKGIEERHKDHLSPNLSYYFALSCCGNAWWTKVQTVDVPLHIRKLISQLN